VTWLKESNRTRHLCRTESGVAIGSYAIVLFVRGLTDWLTDLADPRNDAVGLQF
jgi:hypothetical protein